MQARFYKLLKGFLLLGLLVYSATAFGQSKLGKTYSREFRVSSINDSFLGFGLDHYYTNGLHLSYSQLFKNTSFLGTLIPPEQRKIIFRIQLAHEIYTPRIIQDPSPSQMDRPYAGYLFIKADANTFWRFSNNIRMGLILGVIGPASGAEEIQTQWHDWFGLDKPKGWQFQINNEPVINLDAAYQHAWFVSSKIDAIATTGLRAGTAFNDLLAGLRFRFGSINPLSHSSIAESRFGAASEARLQYHEKERFFFLGLKNKFVFYNALIEGGLINKTQSAHIRTAEPYVLNFNGGFSYSTPVFTWRFIMNQITPEVKGAKGHNFVSIDVAIRF